MAPESAPALIKRYRADMIRRTEDNPAQAGKKACVEASATYDLSLDKLWPGTGKPAGFPCQVITA